MTRLCWTVLGLAVVSAMVSGPSITTITLLFVPLLYLVLVVSLTPYLAWLTRGSPQTWNARHTVRIDEQGIERSGASGHDKHEWAAVSRFVETRHFVLFFTAPAAALYIPKSVLSGEGLESLRQLATGAIARAGGGELPAPASVNLERLPSDVVLVTYAWDSATIYRAGLLASKYGPKLWPYYLGLFAFILWNSAEDLWREWRDGGLSPSWVLHLFLALAPLIMVSFLPRVALWWHARGILRQAPTMVGPLSIAIGPDGIRSAGALFTGHLAWNRVVKIVEAGDCFLFYISAINAIYVPKAAITPSRAIDELRELALSKISARYIMTRVRAITA